MSAESIEFRVSFWLASAKIGHGTEEISRALSCSTSPASTLFT
jgi:hypothetical protein